MALHNTSERYNYIYGNAARKLEIPSGNSGLKGSARQRSRSSQQKPSEKLVLESPRQPSRQARARRTEEHALDFDWKYTVIATAAALVFVLCAIIYIRGTIHLHNLSVQVTELKEEKSELLSKQTALESEIDKSVNLEEIRTYAAKKLGMVTPGQNQVIYYKKDSSDYFRQFESIDTGK